MAAVANQADQSADLLQKLSLDSQAKTVDVKDAVKKPLAVSGNVENGLQTDRSVTPILPDFMDPTMYYMPSGYPYYYGGYEGSGKEWEDFAKYMNPDGVEMSPGAYGDNGSFMYHPGYGYTPYAPYSPAASPVPTMGHDGQLYGAQQYQYPSPYFQSMVPTSGPFPTTGTPAKANAQAPLAGVESKSKANGIVKNGGAKGNNGAVAPKAMYPNSSFNANGSYGRGSLPGGLPSGFQDPRFAYDGWHSPLSWLESPNFSDGQQGQAKGSAMTSSVANGSNAASSRNHNYHPQLMALHHPVAMSGMEATNGYYNRMYPNKLYGQYGNGYRSGLGYGTRYDSRGNGRSWMSVDSKYKPRGRGTSLYGYGGESVDGLNELNRGPRAKISKNTKGFTPVAVAVKGQNMPLIATVDNEEKSSSVSPDREKYNRPDFPETLADAKFFVIKSYSEDDIHKSIKYNVWASTPNGNKKLDAAYSEAQQKFDACPIFLFFSVNTSGQFVGVAEMVGPVDFNKSVDYWQQDKWVGCFPVKWHIVKDVPNSLLKHIILEYNENKPVTNSRDTQEVKLDQGLEMLKIFKDHTSKQCILDDFDFYEDRQKRIQEKKAKQQQYLKQGQVWEGKSVKEPNKEIPNGDVKSQNSATELTSAANPDIHSNGDAPESKAVVVNGVTNG